MTASETRGRTIRLYLVDGSPTGVIAAQVANWTGQVLVAPRQRLADLAARDEVKGTGIYGLVGADPDGGVEDRVYLGEADHVSNRLAIHDREEVHDFWTRTLVVTSKDGSITKSHARFLESRLIRMTRAAGRAVLANATAPPLPSLPEADTADTEYFLAQIGLVLPVLGFHFLQPKPTVMPPDGSRSAPAFDLERVGVRAEAREVEDEFVVSKGSTARRRGTDSWTSYRGLRDRLVASGKLVESSENPEHFVFAEDVAFSSPSAAASVIMAANVNGRDIWQEPTTGMSYAEFQEQELKRAGVEPAAE